MLDLQYCTVIDRRKVRGDWAMARIRLTKSNEHNKRFLQLVDTALFVLCLDHTSPSTPTEVAEIEHGFTSVGIVCFRLC